MRVRARVSENESEGDVPIPSIGHCVHGCNGRVPKLVGVNGSPLSPDVVQPNVMIACSYGYQRGGLNRGDKAYLSHPHRDPQLEMVGRHLGEETRDQVARSTDYFKSIDVQEYP